MIGKTLEKKDGDGDKADDKGKGLGGLMYDGHSFSIHHLNLLGEMGRKWESEKWWKVDKQSMGLVHNG